MNTCKLDECGNKHHGKGYCKLHWQHIYRYGEIKYENRSTERKIIVHKNYAKIPLGVSAKDGYALIDLNDIEKVDGKKWYRASHGYVVSHINDKIVYLHRYIMDAPDDKIINHKKGNTLDNRRSELEITNQTINNLNPFNKLPVNNTSGHKGVVFYKRTNKWGARIKLEGITYHLGLYSDFEDAKNMRLVAESHIDELLKKPKPERRALLYGLKPLYSHNTSGYTGVSWYNRERRWYAFIRTNKKILSLGYFKNKNDAVKARLNAEKKYL